MPQFAQIEIEGGKELASLLRRIKDKDLQRMLRRAHIAAAEVVAVKARANVPVQTGRLRSSIKAGATQRTAYVRAGGTKATPYGASTHWGRRTGNVGSAPGNHKGVNVVKANQFLWRAGNESIGAASVIYEREIGKVFDALSQLSKGGSRGA